MDVELPTQSFFPMGVAPQRVALVGTYMPVIGFLYMHRGSDEGVNWCIKNLWFCNVFSEAETKQQPNTPWGQISE